MQLCYSVHNILYTWSIDGNANTICRISANSFKWTHGCSGLATLINIQYIYIFITLHLFIRCVWSVACVCISEIHAKLVDKTWIPLFVHSQHWHCGSAWLCVDCCANIYWFVLLLHIIIYVITYRYVNMIVVYRLHSTLVWSFLLPVGHWVC